MTSICRCPIHNQSKYNVKKTHRKPQILSQHIFFHFVFNFKLTSNGKKYRCRCSFIFFLLCFGALIYCICSFPFDWSMDYWKINVFGCRSSEKMATKAQSKSRVIPNTSEGRQKMKHQAFHLNWWISDVRAHILNPFSFRSSVLHCTISDFKRHWSPSIDNGKTYISFIKLTTG